MTAAIELMKVPVISTAHLDQQTAQMLTEKGDSNPFLICAPYENGYFIWAAGDMDEDAPKCLANINVWARVLGHDWVRLDSDARKVKALPTYDW